jgi:O-antigen ligase
MTILIAAAMPVRIGVSVPIVHSVSILDVLLLFAAVTLLLDLAYRPLDLGYSDLFVLLCIPLLLTALSVVWSEGRTATARAVLIFGEGIVAYLFVIRELEGLGPERVVTYMKRYVYLLIIPGILLLLHVPGFAPAQPGLDHSSGDYIAYYTRLSHPVLGRSNNLATVLAFFAPILLYWGYTHQRPSASRAGVIAMIAIFATLSRGVLLAFLIGGIVYAAVTTQRRSVERSGFGARVLATAALGTVTVALLYAVNPATHRYIGDRLSLTNVEARSQLISASLDKIASRPLLGFGGGVEPTVVVNQARPARIAAPPLLVPSTPVVAETSALDAHNAYLQQVLDFGLPLGLLVSLAVCATVGVFLTRRASYPVAGVIAYAVIVQLVSFLFESSFEGTVLRVLFYLSIGLAAGLLRAVQAETWSATAGP